MSTPGWSGRRVAKIVAMVLTVKGTTCWLCGLPGADSADHDPPRSVLLRLGVPDPDDLQYLNPAHRYPCNISRQARVVTPELRAVLRAKREAYLVRRSSSAALSPRFASRRPNLLRPRRPGSLAHSFPLSIGTPEKTTKVTDHD